MTGPSEPFGIGTPVSHPRHGAGRVVADMGATVVVRFGGDLEQVLARELRETVSLAAAFRDGAFSDPIAQTPLCVLRLLPLGQSTTSGGFFHDPAFSCSHTSYGSAAR